MKTVTMKARSSSGAWTDVTLPAWLTLDALKEARIQFQAYQEEKRALGYVARTQATTWIRLNRSEWDRRLTGFHSLMVAYALCLEETAIKFEEREW